MAEALANYLALLGWGPPDGVEIRPMAEIIERFRLEDVNKAWRVLRREEADPRQRRPTCASWSRPRRSPRPPSRGATPSGPLPRPTLQGRGAGAGAHAGRGATAWSTGTSSTSRPSTPPAWDKAMKAETAPAMLDGASPPTPRLRGRRPSCTPELAAVGEGHGLKLGKAQAPVRVAVTGTHRRPAAVRVARGAGTRAHAGSAAGRSRPALTGALRPWRHGPTPGRPRSTNSTPFTSNRRRIAVQRPRLQRRRREPGHGESSGAPPPARARGVGCCGRSCCCPSSPWWRCCCTRW